jgi:hypothetical protein
MNTIAGIYFERPVLGKPNYVRIDMNRYGEELKPFFEKIGFDVVATQPIPKGCVTVEEFTNNVLAKLKKYYDDNGLSQKTG